MTAPTCKGFLFSCSSVACRHLSGLFDPDGIRDTAPKHLTLFSSDMSVGLCHASVGQPICHQTSFTLGPITASAIVATVGDPKQFKSGRQFAAWLGLVPQQRSSGGKERLGGISKRGDGYIRRLLLHGARAIVGWRKRSATHKTPWIERLLARRPTNVATVAYANKLARIAWAIMMHGNRYNSALAFTIIS